MKNWISLIVGKAEFDAPSLRASHRAPNFDSASRVKPGVDPRELGQRRGEVLRGLFPKLATWLEDAADRAHRREVEEYLSKATDLADLEQRIRRLERRPVFPYY